jgi:TRAP-type C4-dicarboxylate transport system permease small subunit
MTDAGTDRTDVAAARLRVLRWIDVHVERLLMVVFYGYFCVIIFVEVVLRYGFGSSTGWGEMTARYAFVFLASLAVAEAARTRDHIRIDLLPSRLQGGTRLLLYLYFDLLQIALASLVVWYAWRVIGLQWSTEQMMQSIDLNMAFAYIALPLGWGLFIVRVIRRLAADVRAFRTTGEVPLGGEGFSA